MNTEPCGDCGDDPHSCMCAYYGWLGLDFLKNGDEMYKVQPQSAAEQYILQTYVDHDDAEKTFRDRIYKTPKTTRSLPFDTGFVRLVDYYYDDHNEIQGRVIAYCPFRMKSIRRMSERVSLDEVADKQKSDTAARNHPLVTFDLTTVDRWQSGLINSKDFRNLPLLAVLRFSNVSSLSTPCKEENVVCTLTFRKVVPRRYIDCAFDTGTLFCYALDTIRVTRVLQRSK